MNKHTGPKVDFLSQHCVFFKGQRLENWFITWKKRTLTIALWIILLSLQTRYNFSHVDPRFPLQLLPHLVTLLMGMGNVTHPRKPPVIKVCKGMVALWRVKEEPPTPRGRKDRWRKVGWCSGLATWKKPGTGAQWKHENITSRGGFVCRQHGPGVKWTVPRREAQTHAPTCRLPLRERLTLLFLWEMELPDILGCLGIWGPCQLLRTTRVSPGPRWIHNGQRLCSELADIICRWVNSWHIWALGMDWNTLHQNCKRNTPI